MAFVSENLNQKNEQRPVAVFDIDGTIFRSSLLIKLVEELVRRGDFPEEARAMYEKYEGAWEARSGSYEAYIDKVVAAFTKHVKGLEYKTLYDAAQAVGKREHEKRYRYTMKLIAKLKKQNYFLLAISQSPWVVLEGFCKPLGFEKVYGRFYELGQSDRLTGKVLGEELISDKSAILRRAVRKHNLTLKNSIAVGDTEGDIPMLSAVEHPICFNPNASLAKVAKANGWDIVVERKDVMYQWSTATGDIRTL